MIEAAALVRTPTSELRKILDGPGWARSECDAIANELWHRGLCICSRLIRDWHDESGVRVTCLTCGRSV